MKKLVSESLSDVLKPVNIIGKKYYIDSSFSSFPNIIIEIVREFYIGEYLDNFEIKMLYNTMQSEGPDIFNLTEGEEIEISAEDLQYYGFKEFDNLTIEKIQKDIDKLEEKRDIIQNFL